MYHPLCNSSRQMWPTFKTEHPFKEAKSLPEDVRLATLAFGFTMGFGYFVVWHAIKQSHKIQMRSAYIIMCWVEIAACIIWAILSWLFITGSIGPSFWLFFSIVTIWSIQIQLLLQIIINRICILLPNSSQRLWLKFTVAAWIVLISISVYCIWIPAKLQISEKFIRVNLYWDHAEKILYLFTDAALNIMFIRLIRERLVSRGLTKYDKLVAMNTKMIFVSLSMDVVIIGMLSYRNDLVYMQFHPVAFMVKLEIEMCMSRLMVKVARGTGIDVKEGPTKTPRRSEEPHTGSGQGVSVHVTTQVITHTDNLGDYASSQDHSHRDERHLDSSDLCCELHMMPPRSKRKRAAAPTRVTRSKAQAPRASGDQATTQGSKSVNNGTGSGPGPSTRRARPHLIMEVVLPASKRPTPKTSSAPTPVILEPATAMPAPPDLPSSSPIQIPEPIRESTPQVLVKGDNKKPGINELPPSSPPPMSSPAQEIKWDGSSDPVFSTPTPSPSRRRSKEASAHQPTPTKPTVVPQPSSPPADLHPELEVVRSDHSQPPQEETHEHKPPTSPAPYSDTLAADDPFGFLAAEGRLRERRVQMGIDDPEARPSMPSSAGLESLDQSTYEEAFASIFYDPESGVIAAPSDPGSQGRSAHASTDASLYNTDGDGENTSKPRLKRKQTMEVVVPAKGKGKEKLRESKQVEETPDDPPPTSKVTRSKRKGKEKAKEPTITTYELEAMLPHRIKRTRRPRTGEENISLSDIDSDEPSSPPKKSKAVSAAKKTGRGATKSTKKDTKSTKAGASKVDKPTTRQSKRVRTGEMADMDDDTRKRFEAERKHRVEAYKALDTYTLEEEEVVW
ncbi:unnamed protein product [Rhizoctonia solani]|uniref:Uncharacterized protein n=1 Tax=Rhizoctonia solani TaxID=456999 RepID=A0A8H3E242_9AGAM|nr:unnamed protein product [Rhizoctonia solani]